MKKILLAMLALMLAFAMFGCASEETPPADDATPPVEGDVVEDGTDEDDMEVTPEDDTEQMADYSAIAIGKADYAAHGERAFAVTSVALSGDMIVDVYIDEYQYASATDYVGVPNSDKAFGEAMMANDQALISKRTNIEAYSTLMSENGGATQTLDANWAAIEDFCTGMTVADLEAWVTTAPEVDAIAGSTLADTVGYAMSVVEAAKNAQMYVEGEYSDMFDGAMLGKADYAAHGERAFAYATAAVKDGVIVAAYVDEYQYLNPADYVGVPNSDKAFGEAMMANELVLGSKRTNMDGYSANMANSAGSTQTLEVSWGAIQDFCTGMTVADLEAWVATAPEVDAVAGSTLADTVGYAMAILEAAKMAG